MQVVKMFFAAALLSLSVTSAQAVIIQESFVTQNLETGWGDGEYTVINDSTQDIYAFAVGNDTATEAWSNILNWNAVVLDAAAWDTGFYTMNFNWEVATQPSDVGAFANLFPGFNQVVLFNYEINNVEIGSVTPLAAGNTVGGFMFSTQQLASPFVAIGQNGNIIAQGQAVQTSPVPLPAAVWLFGTGLVAMGVVGRRRKA